MRYVFICFVIFQVSPSWAELPEKSETEDRTLLSGVIEIGYEDDSNIFQEKIEEESDRIWLTTLSLNYRPDLIRWTVLAVRNQYVDNPELSYSFFEMGAERPIGERGYGNFFVQASPAAPLDKDESLGPPISVRSLGISALYDRDFSPFWNVGLSFSYDRLIYNELFRAKDTNLVKIGFPQFIRLSRSWQFFVDAIFEAGTARGGAVPSAIDPTGFRRDDISFRAKVFSLQTSYTITPLSRVRLQYLVRRKTYTADRNVDPLHFGRKDTSQQFHAGLAHQTNPNITLRARLRYLWRESTDTFVEFEELILSFSIAYRL